MKEFAPELAAPAGKIFRNIVQTGDWPKPWRTEYCTPLQKTNNPISEDYLLNISFKQGVGTICDWLAIGVC